MKCKNVLTYANAGYYFNLRNWTAILESKIDLKMCDQLFAIWFFQ